MPNGHDFFLVESLGNGADNGFEAHVNIFNISNLKQIITLLGAVGGSLVVATKVTKATKVTMVLKPVTVTDMHTPHLPLPATPVSLPC